MKTKERIIQMSKPIKNEDLDRQLHEELAKRDAYLNETMHLTEQHDALQRQLRRDRLAKLAQQFYGQRRVHVELLDHLAETVGEDSELFQDYLRNQRAVAAQIKDTKDFSRPMETIQ